MAGLGARFRNAGYTTIKPLIPILASPMINWLLHNLKLTNAQDQVWIALQREVEKSLGLKQYLVDQFRHINFNFILLKGPTRGAAETVQNIVNALPEDLLNRRVVTLDCDTFYFSDILSSARSLPQETGGSGYFRDDGNAPVYSYISFADDEKTICQIAEKVAISRNANTGAYSFADSNILKVYLRKLLSGDAPTNGEFYISDLLTLMMKDGHRFKGFFVEDFLCVGTPTQLESALKLLKKRSDLEKYLPCSK